MANTVTSEIRKHGTQFEQQHVRYVYDEIATSMNDLRHKAWPNVKRFLKSFPPGSLIADIGCGNGRYLSVNKSTYKIGVDVCTALVNNARNKGHEVAYGDNLQIPFRDNSFDGVVSIGVIHHFCSSERRIAATKELSRILRPGGKLMLYVWAFEQNHRKFDCQDVLIPWHGTHKGRQLRTGSSSSIQSYGQSSTSSVSEDEVTDQSLDITTSSTSSPTFLKRQNSLSADDLSMLQELSDFKPNYYSLDFNGSPQRERKKSDSDVKYVWNKNGARIYHSSASTNKLISECRKLEASLRALSAGNLDEMDKNNRDEDFIRSLQAGDNSEQLNDIDLGYNSEITDRHIEDNDVEITLDWNVGVLENDDFEAEIPSEIPNMIDGNDLNDIDSDEKSCRSSVDMNCNSKCKIKIDYPNSCEPSHESWKTSSSSNRPKFNPFLKDYLLEPHHYNSFSSSCEEVESYDATQDLPQNSDDFSEVCVDFKPLGKKKPPKKSEVSFFSSVKSKLLEIFDDDSNKKSETYKRYYPKEELPKTANNGHNMTFTSKLKPELSMEQLDLATKLNFRVREFPLSSCPDVISDSQSDQSGYSSHPTDQDSANQCVCYKLTENSKGYCKHCKFSSKQNFNNDASGNTEKCQKESDVIDRIYDGYINLDSIPCNGKTEKIKTSKNGALMQTRNAKNGCLISENSNSNPYSIENSVNEYSSKYTKDVHAPEFEKPKDQCNINGKNNQCNSHSSQNGKPKETMYTCSNGYQNSPELNNENDSTGLNNGTPVLAKESSREDDSVFDLGNDSLSSKLCRYYHVFREGEVEKMISTYVTDLQIVQCIYDHGNWCVIAEKL